MLFYENLEEIIFQRHNHISCNELIILSGYVGPSPVNRLELLPLETKVIYGMYGTEGVRPRLHNSLLELNQRIRNTTILYSSIPVHSKCYIWRKNNDIVHALVGSANFSTNGLSIPFKEVLAETTVDTFSPLNTYLQRVLDNCISCDDHTITTTITPRRRASHQEFDQNICNMTLINPRTNEVPGASGLNWGHGVGHTTPNDAYIPIRNEYLRNYPQLFPPKSMTFRINNMGRVRHNEPIEIIWDDGTTMEGLLEGTYNMGEIVYPKQISSTPSKNIMGEYLRNRIGVPSGSRVYKADLDRYGRNNISISLLSEGVYFFDFSPVHSSQLVAEDE